MAFPVLSKNPQECTSEPISNSIKTTSEAGYVQARPRFTRSRTAWDIKYLLNDADWALLSAHDVAVMDTGIFAWTHPVSSTTYNVRYSKRVKETPINIGGQYLHQVEFSLEQV